MMPPPPCTSTDLSLSARLQLERIEALADHGLFMQAHALATELGDYRHWRGARAISLAARLVGHLGAPRLADVLAYLGYRRYPLAAETRLRYARYLLARRGHYRAWRFIRQFGNWLPSELEHRAEWLSFQSHLYAQLRDFGQSADLYCQVQACAVDDPWLPVEHSYALEQEDRYSEALEQCETVLDRFPDYRSAVVQAVQLQFQMNQDDAALARLSQAAARLESGGLYAHLTDYLIERNQLVEAVACLDQVERLSPLLEKGLSAWCASRRCDIACLREEYDQARDWAKLVGNGFYEQLELRLQQPEGKRSLIPVRFVRQHHMTCVPATLSALSVYWSRPVAHLEIAEDICYDGTSHQAERAWAERNGWLAIEFTADWSTSRALIDRGLPFTLTVQYTGSGHLQAVVGYDEPRGTLLIRDPAQPQFAEYLAESLFVAQRSSGPRGMVLLPPEQVARLDGLILPDQPLWDIYYQLTSALEVHRREEAFDCLMALRARSPGHRLALQAQRALSWYDGLEQSVLDATDALLDQYPDDANLILSKASSLAILQPREVQLQWLATYCQARWNEPMISVRYAELCAEDGRMSGEVRMMLERVLRQAPMQVQAWSSLASQCWSEGAREDACEMYRLAACLNALQESYSNQYFRALRCLGRSEEGLLFLQQRQARLGHKSAGPTLTLCDFLEELQRSGEARQLLESAVQQRPQDADLLLALADFYGRHGEPQKNLEFLQRAEPVSRRSSWLRAAVLYSQRNEGDVNQAREWCREASEREPLSMPVHRLYMQVLMQVSGEQAVDLYVDELSRRYPHHCGIAELQVERAQKRSLENGEQALRRLLSSHPQYAWAVRELAICVARQGRLDEARQLAEQVCVTDPYSSNSYSTLGFIVLQQGDREAARESFCQALRLNVDNDYASTMLLDTSANHEESLHSLVFVHEQLVRQVTFGDGWFSYQRQAQSLLSDEVLSEQLTYALHKRPDLWHLWVVMARQHARMERYEKALSLLQEAAERFPLLPRLALEMAQLQKSRGQLEACRTSLEGSFRISPLWTASVSLYVDCLLEQGDALSEAEQLLRRVLLRSPDDYELRAYLAYVLGEQERYVQAADEIEQVLREEPANAWGWNQLARYGHALNEHARAVSLARELVQRRSGDVDAWLALSDFEENVDDKEYALREALRFNPRHRTVNEKLLNLLLTTHRYDELDELLQAPCWGGALPIELAVFGPRAKYAAGQSGQAISAMCDVLKLHPDNCSAWRELADWYDTGGNYPAYIAAAREMVRLEPKVAMSHGYLAHALLSDGQRREALPIFLRAFELDPTYMFAGLNGFDLHRVFANNVEARALLDQLLQASQESSVWSRAWQLGLAINDVELKLRALTFLATDTQATGMWASVIADYPVGDKMLDKVLADGVESGSLHKEAALYWLRQQDASWLPGGLWRGFCKGVNSDSQNTLKGAMLELLANRQNCSGLLSSTLQAVRGAISVDGMVWGMASYAMVNHGRYEMMFDWLSDWAREDTPAWGLDNLALGLRIAKRDKDATAVSRLALERDPDDSEAKVWMAFDAALNDELTVLDEWLERLPSKGLRPYYEALRHLLRGYAKACQTGNYADAHTAFQIGRSVAGGRHQTFQRLLATLSYRLAFKTAMPWWARPLRYLQLRY